MGKVLDIKVRYRPGIAGPSPPSSLEGSPPVRVPVTAVLGVRGCVSAGGLSSPPFLVLALALAPGRS